MLVVFLKREGYPCTLIIRKWFEPVPGVTYLNWKRSSESGKGLLFVTDVYRQPVRKLSSVSSNSLSQMKIWSSHLLDNLSNCLMNLKNSGDSTGFEPMTSAMPVQCSNQLSYKVTHWTAGQFVGLMFSRERNVIWKKCYMQCGVWNQMKIWSSHLLDNLSNCPMNLKNSRENMSPTIDLLSTVWLHYWIFQVHETIA